VTGCSRLPTFLVIGAMKCGTSSLHRYLGLHPEIGVSADKELHFFSKREVHARGLDWYARQFPAGLPCRGEASVTYAKCHVHRGTAERIRDALPGVRLIYLVRDPVERAISHYFHKRRRRLERRPLEQALTEPIENNYTLTSRYMMQLDAYLPYFAEEDMLVVELDSLAADPSGCMRRIFRFLGVDAGFTSDAFAVAHNRTRRARRRRAIFGRPASAARTLHALAGGYLPVMLRSRLGRVMMPEPAVGPRASEALVEHLFHDIARLERFTGRRFAHWYGGPCRKTA
jgi:Sulfotransferase domain